MTTMPCEVCGKEFDIRNAVLATKDGAHWVIECEGCDSGQTYFIALRAFYDDPLDWLAQLAEKSWFNAADFVQVFSRLRGRSFLRFDD